MFDYEFDTDIPISGNFGVRYVKTENTAFGYLNIGASQLTGDELNALSLPTEHDYSNVLPSFNVKFELTDELLYDLLQLKQWLDMILVHLNRA